MEKKGRDVSGGLRKTGMRTEKKREDNGREETEEKHRLPFKQTIYNF